MDHINKINVAGVSYDVRDESAVHGIDDTLTQAGQAADAKAVGNAISSINQELESLTVGGIAASTPEDGEVFTIVGDSGEVVDPEPEDSRTMLYNFDFTQGLTDSVGGVTAVLAGTATQDSSGVHFEATNDQIQFNFAVAPSTHIEYDIASADLAMTSHGRLLTFAQSPTAGGSSNGLLWRSSNGWTFFTKSGWGTVINEEEKTCMSGKTLTLSFDENLIASLYVDGVFWATAAAAFDGTYAFMGSSSGSQSPYPLTVSAVRVYEGEYSGGES